MSHFYQRTRHVMTAPGKPEFPPLFPPGRHEMGVDELRISCVDPFPESSSRFDLFSKFLDLIAYVKQHVVFCELCIDGSFITAKLNPDDVDIYIRIDYSVFYKLSLDAQDQIEYNLNDRNFRTGLHIFLVVMHDRSHENYAWSRADDEMWSKHWAVSRDGWLRGLPVVRIGESDVGLRILRRARA